MNLRPIKPLTTTESREPRTPVPTAIRVTVSEKFGDASVSGWLRNLNGGGMYIATQETLPENAEIQAHALIREGDTVHHLRTDGWVVRSAPEGVAIQFGSLDADTWNLIRHLLRDFAED